MENFLGALAAIAWPAAFTWLIGYRFRDEIAALFNRVKGGSIAGNALMFHEPRQQNLEKDDFKKELQETKELSANSPEPSFLDDQITLMPDAEYLFNLAERDFAQRPNDKTKVLCNLVVTAQEEKFFEQAYRTIYGSQIAFLHFLTGKGNASFQDAEQYLKNVRNQYGNGFSSVADWVAFLASCSFVSIDNNVVRILPKGRRFLKYLIDNGLQTNKPY